MPKRPNATFPFRTSLDCECLESRTLPTLVVPSFSSNASASHLLYIDFNGDTRPGDWGDGTLNVTTPPFDIDGDATTFNAMETAGIREIWLRVAEDFEPFDINVTTVDPGNSAFTDGHAIRIVIGANQSFKTLPPFTAGFATGYALIGSFTDPNEINSAYVFSPNVGNDISRIANDVSHEAGHTFGLFHQSQIDANQNVTSEYYGGTASAGPLMGPSSQNHRTIWWSGPSSRHNNNDQLVYAGQQDDVAKLNAVLGPRADDFNYSSPPILTVSQNQFSASGLITNAVDADRDRFGFDFPGGRITLKLSGLVGASNLPTPTDLDARLLLEDISGQTIADVNPSDSTDATIIKDLAPGRYFAVVTSSGEYGSMGRYTLSGVITPPATSPPPPVTPPPVSPPPPPVTPPPVSPPPPATVNTGHPARLAGGPTDGTAVLLTNDTSGYQVGSRVTFFANTNVGVRVATGDMNGDGIPELVGGAGAGVTNRVVVLDGSTLRSLADFSPFETAFNGGVFVTTADLDKDGKADLVVTPDESGGPIVVVYSGAALAGGRSADEAQITRFFGIEDSQFRGGARATVGDVNGDGTQDVIVAAGFGGGPRVAIFNGTSIRNANPTHIVSDFFAFEPALRNGAYVAAGEINGDGFADLAFGGGPGGAPRVRVMSGKPLVQSGGFQSLDDVANAAQVDNFFAGDSSLRGGIRVFMTDSDGGGKTDLHTASGANSASEIRIYKSQDLRAKTNPDTAQVFDPFQAFLSGGVYIG